MAEAVRFREKGETFDRQRRSRPCAHSAARPHSRAVAARRVMLAGVPVQADAVANLADTVRSTCADAPADRLERAQTEDVILLALTLDERSVRR